MSLFSPLRNQRGAALMILLVMVVVMGLGFGWSGMTWKTIRQREKEDELLWRGTQIRLAIERFVSARQPAPRPGSPPAPVLTYPRSLDDLLKDPNSPRTLRHLRRIYKDPITGEDFVVIPAPHGGIKGVRSSSKERPMKTGGFPQGYEKFKDADSYEKWEFVYEPRNTQ